MPNQIQVSTEYMPIITLTSDFGWQDFYLPALKGAILSQNTPTQLVDITHAIHPYDIVQAAFIFKNCWQHFPEGTIHLISVNDYYQKEAQYLLYAFAKHYFIAPNNGLFSLIFEQLPDEVYLLPNISDAAFPLMATYTRAISMLSQNMPLEEIGTPIDSVSDRITLRPVVSTHQLRGSVIHIDRFGNAIVNITKELFEQVCNGRPFKLYFRRHEPINQIREHYHDVGVGEILCHFNHFDHLEIAVNMGQASTLFGLQVEDTIQIDFTNTTSND